jgi:hypothetical protein
MSAAKTGVEKHNKNSHLNVFIIGNQSFMEGSYIVRPTEIFTNTHEKQGLSGFYDGIVINPPRRETGPRPGLDRLGS